ncbi:MAG: glycoside hydrolase family 26 protein [Chloroflexota bacterium]
MRSLTVSSRIALLTGPILTAVLAVPGIALESTGRDNLVYFGAWVGESVNVPGDLDAFEQAVGKGMAIVHRYSGNPPYLNGEHFDVAWADAARDRGSIPMVSWEPRLDAENTLGQAANGSRDDYIRLWARELKDWGHPLFFRMMWEQNAVWFAWGALGEPSVSQYKQLWRRIVDIFREEGVGNVTFVWSPHVSGFGVAPVMHSYPGDGYVDWVALDGYPYRGGRGGFYATFKPDYDILTSRLSKPLMIAETSADQWNDQAKADLVADILTNQLPNSFPLVRALVWFDEKDMNGVNYSILTAQGPLSREAFLQGLATGYYADNLFRWLNSSPIPVPEVAIPLSQASPTPTPSPTPDPTSTPTSTPTATQTPDSTATATPTPSSTPLSVATRTPSPTATATATAAATPTSTATSTSTPEPTATPVPDPSGNLLSNPSFPT